MFKKINRKLYSFIQYILRVLRRYKLLLLFSGLKINSNSKIGKNCRIICTKGSTLTIINTAIDDGVKIIADHGGSIVIRDSYIGSNSVIVARESINISPNCQIAEMVVIRDQNHNFGTQGKTIVEQGFSTAPILIGNNVWIGAKATILKGVSIGDNTVIGAHSVVNKSCDPNSVYVGVTAKKIN